MLFSKDYISHLGKILIVTDELFLLGVFFEGQRNMPSYDAAAKSNDTVPAVLDDTIRWLDIYFSGKDPCFSLPTCPMGTDFQKDVWDILKDIPYGRTVSYGEIARSLANRRGIKRMSPQAVGNAVSKNPVSIIIPCHRVIGKDGSLVGYAGGLDKKEALLRLENTNIH